MRSHERAARTPIYEHAPTAAAHGDARAEEAAARAHALSEAARARALAEAAEAEAEAERARALEEEVARAVRVPFAQRVRAQLVTSLVGRAPAVLRTAAAEELVRFAVERSLTASFDAEHMSRAVDYMLDQHRLARRLRTVPIGVRALLLRRKEFIYVTLLAMDEDGSGTLEEAEFARGMHGHLGLRLAEGDACQLFRALDLEGRHRVHVEQLEKLLYGVRLGDEQRAALQAAAVERRAQWRRASRSWLARVLWTERGADGRPA